MSERAERERRTSRSRQRPSTACVRACRRLPLLRWQRWRVLPPPHAPCCAGLGRSARQRASARLGRGLRTRRCGRCRRMCWSRRRRAGRSREEPLACVKPDCWRQNHCEHMLRRQKRRGEAAFVLLLWQPATSRLSCLLDKPVLSKRAALPGQRIPGSPCRVLSRVAAPALSTTRVLSGALGDVRRRRICAAASRTCAEHARCISHLHPCDTHTLLGAPTARRRGTRARPAAPFDQRAGQACP